MLVKSQAEQELFNIADWWSANSLDEAHGGFVGEIDFFGNKVKDANKGVILCTRILWFFSEAALYTQSEKYRSVADRVYNYLLEVFDDKEHGGVFWEVDVNGEVVQDKKQIYAQCFAIYALCAYYNLTKSHAARAKAEAYYMLVKQHGEDKVLGGYVEALDRRWQPIEDMRLSDKDLNLPKSMNTHLHVLEAFTAYHLTFPSQSSEDNLLELLNVFKEHIIDPQQYYFKLFFTMDWQDKSGFYSYGHDIEGSWLIWEAVEAVGKPDVADAFRPLVMGMAESSFNKALLESGQFIEHKDYDAITASNSQAWWAQAEAIVGFINAYQISGDAKYLNASESVWQFVQSQHLDTENGEWSWMPKDDKTAHEYYKAGFWKAPYHNGRAMLEACMRLNNIEVNNDENIWHIKKA